MPCSTTRPSPISASRKIILVIRGSRPGSFNSQFLSGFAFGTFQALANAMPQNKTLTNLNIRPRFFGDAGEQARWVARSEESLLPGAALREALEQIWERLKANKEAAAKVAWKWTGSFQQTPCYWYVLFLVFLAPVFWFQDISRDLTEAAVSWCGPVVEKHINNALPFKYFSSEVLL